MMEPAEMFLEEFFAKRTEALGVIVEMRRPFREKYYDENCIWDSRREVVERSAGERVVEVEKAGEGLRIVTEGRGLPNQRWRYSVEGGGETWRIGSVEFECSCRRLGAPPGECVCKGRGWFNLSDRNLLPIPGAAAPIPAGVERDSVRKHLVIAEFMREVLAARTEMLRKEREVYEGFVSKFFAPSCDWTRGIVAVDSSETERVVYIAGSAEGFEVITEGAHFPERYDVRRRGESWLIKEAQIACVLCVRHGANPKCFLCSGTMWTGTESRERRRVAKDTEQWWRIFRWPFWR